jgi:hypothetical protein
MFVNGLGLNEQSLQSPLWRLLVSSRYVNKHGHHRRRLFLICWFFKFFSSETFGQMKNEQSLQRTIYRCFLPSVGSFGHAVSEEKIKKNQPIRNKNCLWRPCLLIDRDKMSNLYRGPPTTCHKSLTNFSHSVVSSPYQNANVSFCHHLASVVRHLSFVNFSHFN